MNDNENVTLLLVDDLEDNLVAMEALLRDPGLRLLKARSGEAALELLLVNEVALALVDVQMPDMDGFELAELMRGSERTKHVPIVFVTAGAHDRKRLFQGYDSGAVDFLYKPIEPHILTNKAAVFVELFRQKQELARESALQSAIFNSANFSSIATDAKGVIQIFNVGAERMLGYAAAEVINKITPADISDPQELIARGRTLSAELGTLITPGFEALVFKASRGIEDIYELTYIRKDGSRFPAVVSVTALRDAQDVIIGYLLIGTDNTARKQASQYARSLLEASLDPLVTISAEGKITDVNEGSIKATGVAREKLIGTDFSDYFTEPEHARQGYQQVFAKGFVTDYPLTIRHKDGRLTDVLYNASVYKDTGGNVLGVFAAARDITARKQAEDKFRSLFESVPDALVVANRSGEIMLVNAQTEQMFGYARSELLGKKVEFLIPERFRGGHGEHRSGYFSDPKSRPMGTNRSLYALRKDGSEFPVEISLSSLDTEDGRLVSAAIRDITDRKRAEDALRESAERLVDEDRRKNEFMAMLAHELRNPLTPIKTAAYLLRRAEIDNPVVVRAQEIIERQSNHLIRLVDDLLDSSRLQSGKVRLKKESLNLTKAVSDAVDSCTHLVTSHNHQIMLNLQGEPPIFIEADPARVVQIIANIVVNAAKYTPNNGIIQVTTVAENGMAVVRVRDNGAGIAQDMLGRIFDLYTQVAQSLDRSEGGLGLGLKLVKELVLQHDGSVEAFSEGLGKGSEFVIRIPLAPTPLPVTSVPARQPGTHCVSRRILLIEDSADIREVMEMLLIMNGHKIETAQDGFQGVDKALMTLPDVALIDIGLPGQNGYEVAKAIRAGRGGDKIVLIALSGYGQIEDKQRALNAGFDDHLTKPADNHDLFTILNDLKKYSRSGAE